MNNHLKQFLKGFIILFWMIVFWLVVSVLLTIFPKFNEDYYSIIFFTQIIFSFFLYLILVLYYFRKSQTKDISTISLFSCPFIGSFLLMQFAQVNIPRLLDVFILLVGILLIYYIVKRKNNNIVQNMSLLAFFLLVGFIYPIGYDNIWYYTHKGNLSASQDLGNFNFKITNRDGISFNMSELKGQTVCVDMWASSCGNCIASMPDFEALNQKFKNDKEYKIISLYCPIKEEQTYEWFKKYIEKKFDYDIDYYYIDYQSFNKLNIRLFPEFLIIDKNSNLVYRGQISYLPYVKDNIYNKLNSINEIF